MNSKNKGSAFERKCCTLLSLWLTDGKEKDCLWRSAMSGGRATVHHARGTKLNRQAGDICAVSPEGHALTNRYYIECKFYRSLDLDSFILRKGKLHKFWRETVNHAEKYNKKPMLIAKQNNSPALLLTMEPWSLDVRNGYLGQICYGDSSAFVYLFDGLLKAPRFIDL